MKLKKKLEREFHIWHIQVLNYDTAGEFHELNTRSNIHFKISIKNKATATRKEKYFDSREIMQSPVLYHLPPLFFYNYPQIEE